MSNRPIFMSESGGFEAAAFEAIGDYSLVPKEIKIVCPEKTKLTVNRLIITIVSDGASEPGGYGSLDPLTNGIRFYVKNKNGVITQERSIQKYVKRLADWAAYCYDVVIRNATNRQESTASVRYTFSKDGDPLTLYPGESYCMYFQDNFSGLDSHTFKLGCQQEAYYG